MVLSMNMFPKTKNIETSFRAMRMVSLVAIVGALCTVGLIFVWAGRQVAAAQQRIYILSAGRAFEAFASDRASNLAVEAKAHIENFHVLFFTLDPDEQFIAGQLKKALYLADGSAKRVDDNLKESGYYAGVISANISQRLTIDSVSIDMGSYPFYFHCYSTEKITRVTSIVTRDLVTEGWLREVNRSDNNPHGFLIERWSIVGNRDVKVEAR
jgi:conjugative transposon TraK protein